jgi:flagellar basal-body rod protein FlgF
MVEQNGVDFTPGPVTTTGAALDVAVGGEGWIAVQGSDGNEAYTRSGSLRITSTGALINGAGKPVLGNGGPIAIPPAETIEIGDDGTISIRPEGQTPDALVVVDRIKLVNPDQNELVKGEDGLMRLQDGTIAVPDAGVRLISGSLEMSNVNAVDAMVNMIALSRQFEAEVKLMKVAEENDSASTQLMSI